MEVSSHGSTLNLSPQIWLHTTTAEVTLIAREGTLVPRDHNHHTTAGLHCVTTARAQPLLLLPMDVLPAMWARNLRSLPEAEQPPLIPHRNSDIFIFVGRDPQGH